jgi:hypothetical protein
MPNQRAEGQKMLPVMASKEFIRVLDNGLRRAGYSTRSQFIRDAIVEKLERAGIPVPGSLSLAPSRTEPATYARNDNLSAPYILNDKPSSKPVSKLAVAVTAAVSHSKQKARQRKPQP